MLYSVYWKGDTDELRAMVYRLGTKRLAKTDRQTDTWGGRRFNPVGASVPAVNDPNKESWSVVTTLLGTWCV